MEATTTREAGQHGSLRLSFERREARTVLAGRYSRSPFGAVRAGYPDGSGIPEVIDGFDLTGGAERFSGYSYAAAAYVLAPKELGPLADELHDLLSGIPGTLASASAPSPGLCTIRVLSVDAHALYRILNQIRDLARRYLNLPVPARELI